MCIFCEIVAGAIPAKKIYENHHSIAFLDIQPVNFGHALIVPKEHHDVFLNTPNEVLHDIMDAVKKVAPAIIAATGADGFNLGMNNGEAAGQAVFHTHFHIIPRFAGDGFRHWPHKEYGPGEADKLAEKIKMKLAV